MGNEAPSLSLPSAPYRGIEPFRFVDQPIFSARTDEVQKLVRLITIYRGIFFYGESGAGKSSLINAGLIPALRDEGFAPERVRVQPIAGQELVIERIALTDEGTLPFLPSRFAASTDKKTPESARVVLSVKEFVRCIGKTPIPQGQDGIATTGAVPVLIFDQFEELITLFEEAPDSREKFNQAREIQDRVVEMLLGLLGDPNLSIKLVLSFREDYLAKVSRRLAAAPQLQEQAFRLSFPPETVLREIIRGPFESASIPAGHFARRLSEPAFDALESSFKELSDTGTINLTEVQIACLALWENEEEERAFLKEREHREAVRRLFGNYLDRALNRLEQRFQEPAITALILLVTSSGTRNIVSEDDLLSNIVRNDNLAEPDAREVLEALSRTTRLVFRQTRGDSAFYEISSEFLIPWITEQRHARERHASSAWWRICNFYQQLKPCRFSFTVVLIALPMFVSVAQGTEVLRTVGEGMAVSCYWYWLRVTLFFAALMLWAISSWYTARILLYIKFPGRTGATSSPWAESLVPRLLGVAPIIIVGCGFFAAARPYDPRTPTFWWLLVFGVFCFMLAGIFYFLLVLRRKIIGPPPERKIKQLTELGRASKIGLAVMAGIALLLLVLFTIWPTAAQILGVGTILCLAAASWVTFGGFLVYLSGIWQFPVIMVLVFLALLFSLWNDNHLIRVVPRQDVKRTDVLGSFQQWYGLVEKNYGAGTMHPLYIVVTEGGGIRAAYWTAIVLGALQDSNPNFASHLFAISGVSGGSLGAVVFDALLAEPARGSFQENAHKILTQDFLSPALGSMLYPDLVQRFIPFPIPYFDRGKSLEMGWEKAWRDTMGNNRLAGSFVDLWKPGLREWMPSLFLNGTSVEKGNRIITSNLRLTNALVDANDAADKLSDHNLGATKAACNIRLSTAAHMSARFTFVSPAGRFADGSHILDGGYFESSGATTAYEIVTRIKDWCAFKKVANVDVKVIMISNNPREPSTVQGQFMSELTAPLYTFFNARNAHGTYAQKAIAREQRPIKIGVAAAAGETTSSQPLIKHIFYFKLDETRVPLPLGWMLSAAAAKTIREQIHQDDEVAQNQSAMDEVLKTLPPPR
jgi:hypothetical protein